MSQTIPTSPGPSVADILSSALSPASLLGYLDDEDHLEHCTDGPERMTGRALTTVEELERLLDLAQSRGSLPVLIDHDRAPWILFLDEDGRQYSRTVPYGPEGEGGEWADLLAGGPLVVAWDGWDDGGAR
ncbi:hypothetical protein AB0F43_31875 [Kribbella sp. NPDC023972]|uniref:hypothetical protein n=1 Tax=Kribbella sp. NPDC023972 TaxID=3154795 RepID=UPI0033E36500